MEAAKNVERSENQVGEMKSNALIAEFLQN